jgi:hypothetical protein
MQGLSVTISRAAPYVLRDGRRSAVQLTLWESESDRVDPETPDRRGSLQNQTQCLQDEAACVWNERTYRFTLKHAP